MYQYAGHVTRVVDGDTVDVCIDLGFKVKLDERFRLANIDAPESYGPKASEAGRAATLALSQMLPAGTHVRVRSAKTGKFGRWIAEVWTVSPDGEVSIKSVNQTMVDEGYATTYGPTRD
jgi:micrococcal nuclease